MNNFEISAHSQKPENFKEQFIYPERSFDYVNRIIQEIVKLESGEIEKISLSEDEERLFLDFENRLGEQLERIYEMTGRSTEIYLDYLTTKEGQDQLRELTGISLKTTSQDEIEKIIFENSSIIANADFQKGKGFSGKSSSYTNKLFQERLFENLDENGNLRTEGIAVPKRVQLVVNPETALEKTRMMRDFKNNVIRRQMRQLSEKDPNEISQLEKAQLEILKMFRRKVNIMITDMYQFGLMVAQKTAKLGKEGITKTEKELLKQFPSTFKESTSLDHSRIDKLRHGASRDGFSERGWRMQISPELKKYAEEIAALGEKIETEKSHILKKQGLDEKKVLAKNITAEQRAPWIEKMIEEHGLLSSYTAESYSSNRNGPAPDNKWQLILPPTDGPSNINRKQKIFADPALAPDMSIEEVATELCGHEIAHILQKENQEKIPLRIMKRLGGSRFGIFSEGGAMNVQDRLSQGIFGYEKIPFPHYTRAMLCKLDGGNYLDCVAAYYESRIKAKKQLFHEKKIDQATFQKEIRDSLHTAIRSAKRLYANGTPFESKEPYLTDSESTVYLEQRHCAKKLDSVGLSKILFVSGLGLDDIVSLIRLNKLNLDNMVEYKYESILKIWGEMKPNYLLKKRA